MDPILAFYNRKKNSPSVVGTEGLVEPPTTLAPTNSDGTPFSTFQNWVWPLPEVDSNHPMVSDGFGVQKRYDEAKKEYRGHFGADIMWPRRARFDDAVREVTARDGAKAKNFIIYPGVPVVCVGLGKVYSSENTPTGTAVKVSHCVAGRTFLSVYRHLQGSLVEKGQIVEAGTALGLPGDNPASKKDPPHLHFELWETSKGGGYPGWNIDPMSVAREWKVVREKDGQKVPYRGLTNLRGTGSGRLPVAGIVFFLGTGGLLMHQLFKSRGG